MLQSLCTSHSLGPAALAPSRCYCTSSCAVSLHDGTDFEASNESKSKGMSAS